MAGKVAKLKTARAPSEATDETRAATGIEPRLQLRMRDILERVVDRSGMKKGEARTAIEATMAVIGEAIENGEDIDLPGFGKLKIQKEKETGKGKAYLLRLIRNRASEGGKPGLAEGEKGG